MSSKMIHVLYYHVLLWTTFSEVLGATGDPQLQQEIHWNIVSGVPFNIRLPGNLTVTSRLPRCVRFNNVLSGPQKTLINQIQGLCFQCDFPSVNTLQKDVAHPCISIQFTRHPPPDSDSTIHLYLHISNPNSQRDFSSCNHNTFLFRHSIASLSESFKCNTRPPTVALLYINSSLCAETLDGRYSLWELLNSKLARNGHQTSAYQHNKAGGGDADLLRPVFQFISANEVTSSDLQILASTEVNGYEADAAEAFAVIWLVGCGTVASEALKLLTMLETGLVNGPVPLQKLQSQTNPLETTNLTSNYSIIKWIVADLSLSAKYHAGTLHPLTAKDVQLKRSPRMASMAFSPQDEGSGMLPSYFYLGSTPVNSHSGFYGGSLETSILQPIPPVKITVHQITNVQIPPRTFSGTAVLKNLKLALYYPRPEGDNLTAEQLRDPALDISVFGNLVTRDSKEWISFDSGNRIIRLRPEPKHVGEHRLVLCATTDNHPRGCEPFLITVRRPAPFRKNFILQILPGIHWCYRVPIYWFEELKVNSFESLELTVNGDSPFSWNAQLAEVCVITVLRSEKTTTLFFHASNKEIAQSVEIEFRLSAKVPPPQRLITRSTLRLLLQWPNQLKTYQLQELTRINASLAHALRVRVNPEVSAGSLFIYDILQFFTSVNDSAPALLELEWIFLPYGLPTDHDKDWAATSIALNTTDSRHFGGGGLPGTHISYVERSSLTLTLSELLVRCKSTSLDGAEVALKAAEESFRPFILKNVQLNDLENSACHTAKRFTEKSQSGAYPSGSGLTGDRGQMILQKVNFQIMPDVITNFTVFAGVSFKKLINAAKAAPLKRIQFMELIDIHGLKLDDSAWLGLTSDNTHLFGLPLRYHTRKEPYLFGIQIYTVDQKTPMAIGFTVEVQDWFDAVLQPQHPNSPPNHRVRLQIIPKSSNRNWVTEPINSLDYRWHLSTAIDRFLRPNCPAPCNPDVGIWEMAKHAGNTIFVVWAQLSLLMETTNKVPDSSLSPDLKTLTKCPWEKINRLQNLLLFAPSVVSVEKNVGLVTGYTTDRQTFHSPWSAPSTSFRLHLTTMGLGTVEAALVDRMGSCARSPPESDRDSSAESGHTEFSSAANSSTLSEPRFTIYTGEGFRYTIPQAEMLRASLDKEVHLYDGMGQRIGSSNWIGLEADRSTIYGIVMGNTVQPITYRFRIAVDARMEQEHVTFSVHVAGSNPQLPSVYNHRVIMRFGAESGKPWAGGHSLSDRWRLVAALDTFLRPQCSGNPSCANNMDVLLLTFNYQAHGFTVIWAQKSLLMKGYDVGTVNDQIASLEQQQHWDKWMKQSQKWSAMSSNRRRRQVSLWPGMKNKVVAQRIQRSPRTIQGCPESDLIHLERRLLGDTGFGLQPLPELAAHLKSSGVGILKEVQMERLGPCAKLQSRIPILIPEPVIGTAVYPSSFPDQYKLTDLDSKQSTSYGPLDAQMKQRNLLLGTLLPICGGVILLLLGVLSFVWYRRRGQSAHQAKDAQMKVPLECVNPETGSMLKLGSDNHFKNNDIQLGEQDAAKSRTDIAITVKRQKSMSHTLLESNDEDGTPPTKPLILPNERPPLKPPEYNLAYTDSPMNNFTVFPSGATSIASGFSPAQKTVITDSGAPKAFYGMRPNPYRNLPPPIDVKPGMPIPSSQLSYAPYRRSNPQATRTPDLSYVLER
ncbi:hypothetical protein CRM22_007091 [Opisthorchis felineus]|uniref:Dystroglycan n=1 Tax=Opisthorchis felineus TaxID=147828 RepID=A0A4S2LHQ6_OPIFE|nr:hypothetical protein CRM22_007091 [Opisthorchis felineus]